MHTAFSLLRHFALLANVPKQDETTMLFKRKHTKKTPCFGIYDLTRRRSFLQQWSIQPRKRGQSDHPEADKVE